MHAPNRDGVMRNAVLVITEEIYHGRKVLAVVGETRNLEKVVSEFYPANGGRLYWVQETREYRLGEGFKELYYDGSPTGIRVEMQEVR